MYQDSLSAAPGSDQEDSSVESSEPASDAAFAPDSSVEPVDARLTVHSFRDELARAMQAAAERERERIEASVDEEATTHVQKVRTRAAAEADELKRLAEEDVTGIRDWSKAEVERIRSEADEQVGARRDRLELHLGQHAAIIDGEIDRVSEAVESYRHELDVFFASLTAERDPSEIARMADTVPAPPDFEVIRAIARADAVGRLARLEEAESDAAAEAEVAVTGEAAQAPEADAAVPGEAVPAESEVAVTGEAAPADAEPTGEAPSDTQAAGDATGDDEPELVGVMDPALSARDDEGSADPIATSDATVDAPSTDAVAEAPEAADAPEVESVEAPVAADEAGVPVAQADDAAPDAESAAAEPVVVAVGAAPPESTASRFLRSLTSWGSSSEHGTDLPK